MKLKHQVIIYVVFLHLVIGFFAFAYFLSQPYWFLLIEAGLLLSLFVAFRIFRHLVRPLDMISSGIQSIRDRDFTITYRKTGSKELDSLVELYNRMIRQLREERTIQQEQHYFLQKLMEAAPVGIIILDGNDCIRQWNQVALRILNTGSDQLTGKKVIELPSPFSGLLDNLVEDHPLTFQLNAIQRYRITRAHFMNLGFRNSFILIDELTNEVLAAEKEAFGKAIRMMSHEVNNSIGATNSILQTLKTLSRNEEEKKEKEMADAINVIMERNDNLNRFMNNLADVIRLPAPDLSMGDLNHHIQAVYSLMKPHCAGKGITLSISLPDSPYMISMDAGQIEQLLVNVIKNAMESISGEGTISIILDPEKDQLRIEDSGAGIPPEVEKRLFSPFYSSKKNGQGIGLTLSREIAHHHGFGISLKNRPEGGAAFILFLKQKY